MKNPKPMPAVSRLRPPGIPNPTCPVFLEARDVLDNALRLHRAVRRLRRSTQRCFTCPERRECPTIRFLAGGIDSAIQELCREWGLVSD